MSKRTAYRICGICEAACGLKIDVDGREVVGVKANDEDVFSTGHICAKGIALAELDADVDRLTQPLIKDGSGFRSASWDEAWSLINEKLNAIATTEGRDAIATYAGNPTAHNIGLSSGFGVLAGTLGSKNLFTAASVDQIPKQLASELMFGNDMALPVPDIEHCDYFLMLGANPVVSNGSLWVVPKVRDKIRAMQKRGGELVVVDPRRTETARAADHHIAIKPGSDAFLLAALFNALLEKGCTPPDHIKSNGFAELATASAAVSLEKASHRTGLDEAAINHLAINLMAADHPVVYGRVGTTLQAYGTLTSFLVEAINLVLGALDKRGGAMFPDQPYYTGPASNGPIKHNRYQSRVSQYPEVIGQMPVVALAEEIETEGAGQIKALVCMAGNPVVSNPDSKRLAAALESLDFMVCIDLYHNETTRLADVILPGTSPFEDGHYDAFLGSMGYRNAARYSPPVFETNTTDEWAMGLTLSYCLTEQQLPTEDELHTFEDNIVAATVAKHTEDPASGIYGRDVQTIMGQIGPQRGVERLLDIGIRAGRWGDHFGERDGLTLAQMANTPNGIDLGEISESRLSEVVQHSDHALQLAPEMILDEFRRLNSSAAHTGLSLIGRRSPRSNNSWLRNLASLGKGKDLCALQMNPQDAEHRALTDGARIEMYSDTGQLEASLEITDAVMPGVVCLPHGFSEALDLRQSKLARGPNFNQLVPLDELDVPSSTPALNGVSVEVRGLT